MDVKESQIEDPKIGFSGLVKHKEYFIKDIARGQSLYVYPPFPRVVLPIISFLASFGH